MSRHCQVRRYEAADHEASSWYFPSPSRMKRISRTPSKPYRVISSGSGHWRWNVLIQRDPPEGWGWCFVDKLMLQLPDQTLQNGPIPQFF
jgi:hypothetical protein